MDEQKLSEQEREAADDKMINDAFQRLLNNYLASRHRKKVEVITKAFNFARQAHKGVRRLSGSLILCILSLLPKLLVKKWD